MDSDENQDDNEKTNGFKSKHFEKICGYFGDNITK
jgi:hypothetical protein